MSVAAQQIELHGSRFGLNTNNDIIANGRIAYANGPRNKVTFTDDFLGDVIFDEWNTVKGSDAGSVLGAINSQINGVLRLVMGASATGTMATNGSQLDMGAFLNFRASNDGLVIQTRSKVDVITSLNFFSGFTNQGGTLQAPFTIAGGTLTANAANAVGIVFDTAATAATYKLVGVKATVAQMIDTGIAPTAATFDAMSTMVDIFGNAYFYINHKLVGRMANAITPTTPLTPVVNGFSQSAVTRNFDLDYIQASMYRA